MDLYKACYVGDLDQIRSLILNGHDDFSTGLTGAINGRQFEAAKIMLDRGAMATDKKTLGLPCVMGNLEIVNLLIEHGANNFNDGLYYASQNGHLEIAKLMCDCGADNFNEGMSIACLCGRLELVKLMLDRGANHLNYGVYKALYGPRVSLEIIKLLIEKGANDFYYINKVQCIQLLNMGVNMNGHKDTAKLKEHRDMRINEVKDHFDQLNYYDWDHNIITPLICDYVSYGEKR